MVSWRFVWREGLLIDNGVFQISVIELSFLVGFLAYFDSLILCADFVEVPTTSYVWDLATYQVTLLYVIWGIVSVYENAHRYDEVIIDDYFTDWKVYDRLARFGEISTIFFRIYVHKFMLFDLKQLFCFCLFFHY